MNEDTLKNAVHVDRDRRTVILRLPGAVWTEMTPEQARRLAKELIEAADRLRQ